MVGGNSRDGHLARGRRRREFGSPTAFNSTRAADGEDAYCKKPDSHLPDLAGPAGAVRSGE